MSWRRSREPQGSEPPHQVRMTAGILVLIALAAALVEAWGPATHYYMTCQALDSNAGIEACLQNRTLISGTNMPDAFIFGSFVFGSPCVGVGELHDLIYAGYLVKQAVDEGAHLDIALGFGAHVAGDYGGFFPGGYLGSGNETAGRKNWISLWPFMTAVDAWVAQVEIPAKARAARVAQPLGVPFINSTVARFMKRARDLMAIDFPTITPNITADLIGVCAASWEQVVTTENLKAQALPVDSYGFELVYNDRYGATNVTTAVAHLRMALYCGVQTILAWQDAILNATVTPAAAATAAGDHTAYLFSQGLCRPVN